MVRSLGEEDKNQEEDENWGSGDPEEIKKERTR
jgi:hypothetical protein